MEQEYYKPFVLTELGLKLRQQAIGGAMDGSKYTVDFTRAVIGRGRPATEDDMFALAGVVDPVVEMPVKVSYAEEFNHILVVVVDNTKLTQAIMMTEVGVMARLLDVLGQEVQSEIMYGYTYTNRYDYLPNPASGNIILREMLFDTVISQSDNVNITFDASRVYATVQELQDHIFDPNAHTPFPLGVTFNHGLGRYPGVLAIEFTEGYGMQPYGIGPYGGSGGRQLHSRVEYIDRDNIRVHVDKSFGVVSSFALTPRQEYVLTFMDSASTVYVILTGVTGYGGVLPDLPQPILPRRGLLASDESIEEGILRSGDGALEDMYLANHNLLNEEAL